MKTNELINKLREMSAQILTPSSKGKEFFSEVADRLHALNQFVYPTPDLKGAHPVVIYFNDATDAEECIRVAQQSNPNLKAFEL